MKNPKPLFDVIADQALTLQQCIGLVDDALNQCNDILRDLQPFRRSGQIGLLETRRKSSGKIVINEVQWRVVRWQRQAESPDGKTRWRANAIPLKGAGHRVKTQHDFRDVAEEVRGVVHTAVRLIRWRAQLTLTARNFVVAVEGHWKSGATSCQAMMAEARDAVARAELKKDAIRKMVRQVEGTVNAVIAAPNSTPAIDDSSPSPRTSEWTDLVEVDDKAVVAGWDFQHIPSGCWIRVESDERVDGNSSSEWTLTSWMATQEGDGKTWEIHYPTAYFTYQRHIDQRPHQRWPLDKAVREAKKWFLEKHDQHLAKNGRRRQ